MANFNSTDFIQDYSDLLELVKTLTSKWDPSVSDEADPGVVLLKLAALMKDKLTYKQDLSEAQAYLDTVSDRQSAFELLQMLGYVLKGKKSATGQIQITLPSGADTIILQPFTTVFSDEGNTRSYFLLPISQTNFSVGTSIVNVMEGSAFNIEKEGIDHYSAKDIDESGRFYLGVSDVAQNGVFIGVKEADTTNYTSWVNLDASSLYPEQKYFFVLKDSTGENYLQFPSNYAELLGNAQFEVKCTYSLGSGGNIRAGSIRKITASGVSVQNVRLLQPEDFITGEDEESISQGIQNYYRDQKVFNTLVTSHDFQSAIRQIKNPDIFSSKDALPNRFSNCWARTAIDRQQTIMSRVGEAEYEFYSVEKDVPDYQIDACCLQNSTDYDKSFEIYSSPDSASDLPLQSEIEKQLKDASSLRCKVNLDNSYLRADATLSGVVMANVTTKAEANEVLKKIISTLKAAYIASKETFGKKIDYAELLQLMLNADSRIVSLSVPEPTYQIKKVTKAGESFLSANEKLEVAKKAVLNGQVPIYKFTNRSNTSALAVLNPGYINRGLGMTDYEGPLNTKDAKVTVTDVGYKYSQDNLNGKIAKMMLVQFRKPLTVEEIQYGYGTEVSFTWAGQLNSTLITSTTKLLKGSKIAKGSTITLSATATQGLVEKYSDAFKKETVDGESAWVCKSLPEDYIVLESVEFNVSGKIIAAFTPKLAAGSAPTKDSIVNGANPVVPSIHAGSEYVLGVGEELRCKTSSSETTYSAGDTISVSGITLEAGNIYYLGSNQIVSKLKNSTSTIDAGRGYFIISNNPIGFQFINGEYFLEENEFFVYTNETLSEYLILGAGTLLKSTTLDLLLNNVRTSSDKDNIKVDMFKSLPVALVANEMEISTFDSDYRVSKYLPSTNPDDYLTFKPLTADVNIYKGDATEVYQTFSRSKGYEMRVGLLLSPNADGVISFRNVGSDFATSGIELKLTIGSKELSLSGKDSKAYSRLLFSQFYQRFLTQKEQSLLTDPNLDLEIAVCKYNIKLSGKGWKCKEDTLSARRIQYEIETSTTDPEDYAEISLNLTIPANTFIGIKHVVQLKSNIPGDETAVSFKIVENASLDTTQTNMHPEEGNNSIWTKFFNTKTDTTLILQYRGKGLVTLEDYSIVSGYADELLNLNDGEDTFNLNIADKLLESELPSIFNYFCIPRERFSQPTKSVSYFSSAHPENYRVLPHLILDEKSLSETLKILPVTGRI